MKMKCLALALAMMLSVTTNVFAAEKKDIVDTAVAAGDFKTLATALQAAGLVDTLKGPARSPFSRPPTKLSPICRRAPSKNCSNPKTRKNWSRS